MRVSAEPVRLSSFYDSQFYLTHCIIIIISYVLNNFIMDACVWCVMQVNLYSFRYSRYERMRAPVAAPYMTTFSLPLLTCSRNALHQICLGYSNRTRMPPADIRRPKDVAARKNVPANPILLRWRCNAAKNCLWLVFWAGSFISSFMFATDDLYTYMGVRIILNQSRAVYA